MFGHQARAMILKGLWLAWNLNRKIDGDANVSCCEKSSSVFPEGIRKVCQETQERCIDKISKTHA